YEFKKVHVVEQLSMVLFRTLMNFLLILKCSHTRTLEASSSAHPGILIQAAAYLKIKSLDLTCRTVAKMQSTHTEHLLIGIPQSGSYVSLLSYFLRQQIFSLFS
ncbi:hypothetical protein Tco_0715322, partial [Tanacetum coccineum]